MKISLVRKSIGVEGYIVTLESGTVMHVPDDPMNKDYLSVQEWIKDGGTIEEYYTLQQAKDMKIAEAKEEASKKIIAIIPEWKQRNMTARAVELLRKEVAKTITGTETTELDNIEKIFAEQVRPIRTASDAIESEINSKIKVSTVMAVDIENNSEWP